ncbi:MAG: hypothetical protein AAGJ46_16525 [Planctomycetota bacterium]
MIAPTPHPLLSPRAGLLPLAVLAVATHAQAAATFWLSTSGASPPGPEVASYSLSPGESDVLYVWARPEAGKQLRNVSLNLLADKTGVDFTDGAFTVLNAAGGSVTRFGFRKDSSTSPELLSDYTLGEVSAGDVDGLFDLQGFSIGSDADIRGMGPGCLAGDANCFLASDGEPAWLFATVGFSATTVGVVNLNLQVGESGINHQTLADGDYNFDGTVDDGDHTFWSDDFGLTANLAADGNGDGTIDAADYTVWRDNLGASGMVESASLTTVRFGVDSVMGVDEPAYNAATDRSITLFGDDADAVITITAPGPILGAAPEPASAGLAWIAAAALAARRANQRRGA